MNGWEPRGSNAHTRWLGIEYREDFLQVFSIPELAENLTLIIQGLIVLLVSAPVIVTTLYRLRPKRSRPDPEVEAT